MKRKTHHRRRRVSGLGGSRTTKMVAGGGLALLAEWGANKFAGGILTDKTGTIIKTVAGALAYWKGRSPILKGFGAGLVVNNVVKLATGKNIPETLGIGGITPYYRLNSGINGTGSVSGAQHVQREATPSGTFM